MHNIYKAPEIVKRIRGAAHGD